MKKFLIYLGAIVATVALGATVFYLVQNNETMSISMNEVYVNTGDEFSIDFDRENEKAYTDVEVVFAGGDDDMTVVKVNEVETETGKTYTFRAGTAGLTQITFRTSNENFRNLSCKVYVGDGSADYPFYITTAEQFQRIGTPEEQSKAYGGYTLNSCYKLMNNIILKDGSNKTGCWIPIGTGIVGEGDQQIYFTGSFNGNGKTISNVMVNKDQYNSITNENKAIVNAGLFSGIGTGGLIYGLKVDGMRIVGKYDNVGTIAGVNYGTIESCQVTSSVIDARDSKYVGGIVGQNLSSYYKEESQYARYIARVDRCSFSGNLGLEYIEQAVIDEESGEATNEKNYDIARLSETVGGLVGYNKAGVIIYSYVEGTVYLSNQCIFGGIVGINQDADLENADETSGYKYPTDVVGGNVKDCYSTLGLVLDRVDTTTLIKNVGGIIGHNITDFTTVVIVDGVQFSESITLPEGTEYETEEVDNNKVIGNYFLKPENVQIADTGESALTVGKSEGEIAEIPETSVNPETPEAEEVEEAIIYGIASQGKTVDDIQDIITVLKEGVDTTGKTDVEIYAEAMQYVATQKTADEMKLQDTYISHATDAEGKELVSWRFDACWSIVEGADFPRLNYSVISISDDIDSVYDNIIRTAQDLANMTLNGNYYIAADIDMNYWTDTETKVKKLWVPIGTEKNPFNGTLRAGVKEYNEDGTPKAYYTISNLQMSTENSLTGVNTDRLEAYRYAGLFGAIGSEGKVYDVHIKTSSMAHKGTTEDPDTEEEVEYCGYIGAIAGVNKGSIVRPVVEGCLIQGDCYVGGIVGCNQDGGTISGAIVSDIKDDSGALVQSTKIYIQAQNGAVYIGGIAGAGLANSSIGTATTTLYTVNTQVEGSVFIEAEGDDSVVYTVYAGGIVGHTSGSVSGAKVHLTGAISIGDELNAYAGGVAGYVNGTTISSCIVQAIIEAGNNTYTTGSGSERTPLTYIGGIAGALKGNGGKITNTATYQNSLTGRFVGGLVAEVSVETRFSMIQLNQAKTTFAGERKTTPDVTTATACIEKCFAEDLSIDEAYKAGGLVCTLDNGLVQNCYVKSPNGHISSSLSGAVMAGFVAEIGFSSSKADSSTGGVIAYSYVVIKVEAVNGNAYSETSTKFKSPTNYSAGYILSYVYDSDVMNKDVASKAEIQLGGWGGLEKFGKGFASGVMTAADWVANLFNADIQDEVYEFYQGISTGSMKSGSSNAKIAECNFNQEVWNVQSGDYLTFKNGPVIPSDWRPQQ